MARLRTIGQGGVYRDTAVQSASKRLRAARAQCPVCGRKSALESGAFDDFYWMTWCRWKASGRCTYVKLTER